MEFSQEGGRLTGGNALQGSWGRWTFSLYLQSKCSGRETTLPGIQAEAKHRWDIRLASHPQDGEAPRPGGHCGNFLSVNKTVGYVRNSPSLKKGHLEKSVFQTDHYAQGFEVMSYWQKLFSWNVFPRLLVNNRTHFDFPSGHRILGKLGKMNLGCQWPGGCVFSFGKARDASSGKI